MIHLKLLMKMDFQKQVTVQLKAENFLVDHDKLSAGHSINGIYTSKLRENNAFTLSKTKISDHIILVKTSTILTTARKM